MKAMLLNQVDSKSWKRAFNSFSSTAGMRLLVRAQKRLRTASKTSSFLAVTCQRQVEICLHDVQSFVYHSLKVHNG